MKKQYVILVTIFLASIIFAEISGLIINQTTSNKGHIFYTEFSKGYHSKCSYTNYTILIEEKKPNSNGSTIDIIIENQLIYRTHLSDQSYQPIKDKCEEALKESLKFVSFLEIQRKMKKGGAS